MFRSLISVTTLLLVGSQIALAQPAPDTKPKGDNPPNARPPFPTPDEEQKLMDDTKKIVQMTPDKQKAYLRGLSQSILRMALTHAGYKDQELQDEIIKFVDEQETFRVDVRAAGTKLYKALNTKGAPVDAKVMEPLVAEYLEAAKEVESERTIATKALDQKIGFSNKPHLEAFLTLNGIIGDAFSLTGEIATMGTLAQGSLNLEIDEEDKKALGEAAEKSKAERKDFNNMTPAQQKLHMGEMNQSMVRMSLDKAGFKDKALQDEILLFVDGQEKSRAEVRKAGGKILLALEHVGVPADAEKMELLLNDYLATVDDARAKREDAVKAFEAKMNLATNPQLRGVLLLGGVVGDASSITGDIIMLGTMAMSSTNTDQN